MGRGDGSASGRCQRAERIRQAGYPRGILPLMASLSSPSLLRLLRETCQRFPVTLAYLFGSHARGTADDESDIDVGVLAVPLLTAPERRSLRLELTRAVSETLATDAVDVVILQDVPVLLQYNVIRRGTLLFARARADRLAYELAVERRYDDERLFLDREADRTIERLLSRRP